MVLTNQGNEQRILVALLYRVNPSVHGVVHLDCLDVVILVVGRFRRDIRQSRHCSL